MRMHRSVFALALGLSCVGSISAADYVVQENVIRANTGLFGDKVEIRVSGPNGFSYTTQKSGGANTLGIDELATNKDGLYKFEILEIKELGEEKVKDEFNGRDLTTRKIVESKVISGQFRVVNGQMVDSDLVEEPYKANPSNTLNSNN